MSLPYRPPRRRRGIHHGTVLHIDRFGNIVTDLRIDKPGGEVILGSHTVTRWAKAYALAPPGEPFLSIGSSGTVEISIRGGRAADALEVDRGAPVRFSKKP